MLRLTAVSCLFGSGIIHGVWMGIHLGEWLGAGIFFLAVAMIQTLGAFAIVAVPGRLTYLAFATVNVATVLVWMVSRTVGVPIGPGAGQAEPVGLPDLVATLLELLTVVALLPLLQRRAARRAARAGRTPRRAYAAMAAIAFYILLMTSVAVVPAAAGHEPDAASGTHDHANHGHG